MDLLFKHLYTLIYDEKLWNLIDCLNISKRSKTVKILFSQILVQTELNLFPCEYR